MSFTKLCFVVLVSVWYLPWLIEGADDFYSAATLKKIAEIDDFINDTVDPCDNFERYACSRVKVGYFEQLTAETNALIKNRILSGKRENDTEAVKKLIDFYQQCTVAFAKRNESVQNMVDDLDDIYKNGTDTFQKFDATMVAKLSAYLGSHHDYAFMIGINYVPYNNSTRFPEREVFVLITEPELSQERDKYDPKNISSYADTIKKGLSDAYAILEPNKTEAEVNATVSELFDFEIKISQLFTFNVTDPEVTSNAPEITVGEATKQLPGIDWRTFVMLISNYSDFDLFNGTQLDDYPLKIVYPDLWKALPNVLENTPDALIRQYIRVRLVNAVSALSLKTDPESDCLSMVTDAFPIVHQYLYITERLPTVADRQKLKSSVSKLADNIIANVKSMMEKVLSGLFCQRDLAQ
uniref:Peptidase_M13_N domain-containing protein n=1 Tax=Panagrellus redivivus TaxID=6233 RepID=A0A7E4WCK1_PANRE